jgi:hypothetical protein
MRYSLFTALISTSLAIPTLAWSYDINLGPLGHACDTCGGGVIGGLPVVGPVIREGQAQVAGNGLEQWIIASHNSAINGSMPIPPQIRQQLTGYASEDSMNRVRYKIGDNGVFNLAGVIEKGGFAAAVTLIDVVVFRGPTEANDPSIWAHERTHVDQYQNWGVHSFAIQYARDYNGVENPAYAKGNGYWQWAQRQGNAQANLGPPALPPMMPAPATLPPMVPAAGGAGAFCYTPIGRFGPGPVLPFGADCSIVTPQGPLNGKIGP